jgi:hypothetical protein
MNIKQNRQSSALDYFDFDYFGCKIPHSNVKDLKQAKQNSGRVAVSPRTHHGLLLTLNYGKG